MTMHTPAPWETDFESSEDRVSIFGAPNEDNDQELLAAVWLGFDKAESRANARLIAAAPELLALAEDIANDVAWAGYCSAETLVARWKDMAKAAIAKARGEG
jgi:hypothetical protein